MATRSEFSMTFLNVMEKLNLAIWFAYLAHFLSCLGAEVHYITLYMIPVQFGFGYACLSLIEQIEGLFHLYGREFGKPDR